jgi:hypothetical protein
MLSFFIFITLTNALTCYQGTRAGPQTTCTANLSLAEQCVTAQLHTPLLLNTTNGTEIYACGNCSFFQSQSQYFTNVSCCSNADLCQVITIGVIDVSTCESINDATQCTNRSDCYWCDSVQAQVGLCKSLNGTQLPCFATSLQMPPTICRSIACLPIQPAYNASQLTRAYLTQFGLPALAYPQDVGLALDIASREVRVVSPNVTYSFCSLDDDFIAWCGINSSTYPIAFKYCVVSETWPQPDLYSWIRNTTATSNQGFDTLFPALCACLTPGRAYYFPSGFLLTQAYYSPPCRREHAILAFYVLLMLVTTLMLIYFIYETAELLYVVRSRKVAQNLIIKLALITYCLITITDQALWVAPQYDGVQTAVVGLLRFLGIIFFEFALVFTIFTLCGILLESGLFGKNSRFFMWFFGVFKWALLVVHCFCFVALFAFCGVITYYYEAFTTTAIPNLAVFGIYVSNAVALAKTTFILLLALVFIMIVFSGAILAYTSYKIRELIRESRQASKKIKTLLYRVVFLSLTFVVLVVWLIFMCLYIYMDIYVLGKVTQSPFISQYESHYALQWLMWAMFVVELIVIALIDIAMRSSVRSTWLFKRVMSQFELSDASSSSSSTVSTTSTTLEL